MHPSNSHPGQASAPHMLPSTPWALKAVLRVCYRSHVRMGLGVRLQVGLTADISILIFWSRARAHWPLAATPSAKKDVLLVMRSHLSVQAIAQCRGVEKGRKRVAGASSDTYLPVWQSGIKSYWKFFCLFVCFDVVRSEIKKEKKKKAETERANASRKTLCGLQCYSLSTA